MALGPCMVFVKEFRRGTAKMFGGRGINDRDAVLARPCIQHGLGSREAAIRRFHLEHFMFHARDQRRQHKGNIAPSGDVAPRKRAQSLQNTGVGLAARFTQIPRKLGTGRRGGTREYLRTRLAQMAFAGKRPAAVVAEPQATASTDDIKIPRERAVGATIFSPRQFKKRLPETRRRIAGFRHHAQRIAAAFQNVDVSLAVRRDRARVDTEVVLRLVRKLPPGVKNDFNLSTADQIIAQFDRIGVQLFVVTLALAGVSLLVGGIGIANVMVMSVTERTREIGLRLAIGARRADVRRQFLIEAAVLSGAGGLLGVAIASVIGLVATRLAPVFPAVPPA